MVDVSDGEGGMSKSDEPAAEPATPPADPPERDSVERPNPTRRIIHSKDPQD